MGSYWLTQHWIRMRISGLQNGRRVPTFLDVAFDGAYFSSRAEQNLRCTSYIRSTHHSWIEIDTARVISVGSIPPNTTVTLQAWKYKLWIGSRFVWHILTLAPENCHHANLVVTGGTRGDNLWYHHWQQSWHQGSYQFQWFPISMLMVLLCLALFISMRFLARFIWFT